MYKLDTMQAEIITIGDEILIGQILDSNSKWIAEQLNEIGISVYQITSIQDNEQHIIDALNQAKLNSDIIIFTGGLGPTKDDITKYTLTSYFNDTLVQNKDIEDHIKYLFGTINYQYTESDLAQALLPSKATIIKNNIGTASGMWFKDGDKVIISLPGVPNEMKGLIKNGILPKLQKKYKLPFILHQTILTYGMGESAIAERLEDYENKLPLHIKLAYLPSYGKTRLRLSTKGEDKSTLEKEFEQHVNALKKLVKDIIIGLDSCIPIEVALGKLLSSKKLTIATAESCTGGNIAAKITSVAGSSAYFIGSVISYNVRIKTDILQVSPNTIEKHSVVSKDVALEMATAIKDTFKTDIAIATTGNAGPTTDKTDKTVGIVYIAVVTPNKTIVKEYNFGQPRERVIEKSSVKAMEILYQLIE